MRAQEAMFLAGSLGPILFGCAALAALRLVEGPRDSARYDPVHTILDVIGRVLLVVGFLGVFLFFFGPLGFLFWVAVLVVFAETLIKHRTAQQYALLWVLTVSAERLIPLVPAIEAFAYERGAVAVQARKLAAMLTAGVPLPDALGRCRGLIPPEALPVIRLGYESGALAPALRQATANRDYHGPIWHSIAGKIVYLCCLPLVGLIVLGFVMRKIVTSFEKIRSDFDAQMPIVTRLLIGASNLAMTWGFVLLPFVLAAGFLLAYTLLRYAGRIRWRLPGTGRLLRRFDTAGILDALSLAARHERPLAEAIESLAQSHPQRPIRRRLQKVARDLRGGGDWCESLYRRGLMKRADLAILQAAGRVGNLPWALAEMAESNRRRLVYRLQALVGVLFPPIILLFGATVMFIVVALFLPLISLVLNLT